MSPSDFFEAARRCLDLSDPAAKCAGVGALGRAVERGHYGFETPTPPEPIGPPGRPVRPRLVPASSVPRRRIGSIDGRAALVHAITHIEFNAINLALDAAYRFRGLPDAYYRDWVSVAVDEARHFRLLQGRLLDMGRTYGDYPAHNGLWDMAEQTAGSCLARMALVPRVLEARGLDVTPGMIARLRAAGDAGTVAALEVILAEEVRHVAIGTHWFRYCCARDGLEPLPVFLQLLDDHFAGALRGPFNLEARYRAGFTPGEMQALSSAAGTSDAA